MVSINKFTKFLRVIFNFPSTWQDKLLEFKISKINLLNFYQNWSVRGESKTCESKTFDIDDWTEMDFIDSWRGHGGIEQSWRDSWGRIIYNNIIQVRMARRWGSSWGRQYELLLFSNLAWLLVRKEPLSQM